MIDDVIKTFAENHKLWSIFELKLEESGMSDELIVKIMFYQFLKKYGGSDVFTEDMMDLVSAADDASLDTSHIFKLPKLCTRKRREAVMAFYSQGVGYGYDKLTSFIFAIDKTQKGIKKTCNTK